MIMTKTAVKETRRLLELAEAYDNLGFLPMMQILEDEEGNGEMVLALADLADLSLGPVYGICQHGKEMWDDEPEFMMLSARKQAQLKYLYAKFFDKLKYEAVIEFE